MQTDIMHLLKTLDNARKTAYYHGQANMLHDILLHQGLDQQAFRAYCLDKIRTIEKEINKIEDETI